MKDKLLHILRDKPVFLFLLPVFFVLHGYSENFGFIPLSDASVLTAVYLLFSLAFSLLFWLLYRNFTKANIVAFCIMAFNFFFGSMHDTLKKFFPGFFLSKYIFILPASLVCFILIIILIKRSRSGFARLRFYLNVLFTVLIVADILVVMGKAVRSHKPVVALPTGMVKCDTCLKPDVYFILADEYAGYDELKTLFSFDNSAFLSQLSALGFHIIPNSRSNYNYTPFSVASILNMDYLQLHGRDRTSTDLTYCYESIRDNRFLKFLEYHGYDFYNYSVFDFEGQPARVRETFLPVKTRLITAQTFLHRFDKDIRFNLVSRWKSRKNLEILTYASKNNNQNIYDLTWKRAAERSSKPKFIYAHLMMPHYPYYFDKNGKERPFGELQEGKQIDTKAYVEYLQYCNNKLLALVSHIQKSSASPPIIILMGDHGFRHFMKPVEFKYYFENLASVYLPSGNYRSFTDSMTSINFMRSVLNTSFGQNLDYLKDSSIYLKD